MGTASLSTGMQKELLVFQVLEHQLQQGLASHSSAVAMSQENLGGGPGAGGGVGGVGGWGGAGGVQPGSCLVSTGVHRHMFVLQHAV